MLKRILFGLFTALLFTANVQAIEFKGTMSVNFPVNQQPIANGLHRLSADEGDRNAVNHSPSRFKSVVLMKANLSAKEKRAIMGFQPSLERPLVGASAGLPQSADIGMGNVPVLDQGQHGSCVTFATTAAMDSLIGKGDYISQLCSLALGNYIEKYSELPSGWEGSAGPIVLNQLLSYGVIAKGQEKQLACGGLTEYPIANAKQVGNEMTLENYHAAREKADNFYWEPILNVIQRAANIYDHDYHPEAVVQAVKKTLTAQSTLGRQARITFGVLLPVEHCFAGACAKYHQNNDTWALTDAINYDLMPDFGGHEMVITGYDDNAVVVDNEGKSHTGIFIIRNSWGADVGDQGNFYMTYDFFKKFVTEVQKIVMFKTDEDNALKIQQ